MAETEKNTNASSPTDKRHDLLIGIQQPQRMNLTPLRVLELGLRQAQYVSQAPWVLHIRNTVTTVVDTVTNWVRPGPGRPPDYDYDAITIVAQELLQKGVDDYFARFAERLENTCKARGIKVPKRSEMRKHFQPMWAAARAQIGK
jgi:hypothetical protein